MYVEKEPWTVNYDESQIPPYELPDALTCQDGTKVTEKEQWISKRRPELLAMFRNIMYGSPLPLPDRVRSTVISEKKDARNGLAIRREIRLDFMMNSGMRHSIIILLYIPAQRTGPVPICVNLTFAGNHAVTDEDDVFMTGLSGPRIITQFIPGVQVSRYPLDYIMKRGYAIAIASYNDFFPDYPTGWDKSIYDLFFTPDELRQERPKDASAIAAWAWGYSRILDCAAALPEIDGTKALCVGHSRLGKTSLWAGVQDERFGVVCVNDAGCGGSSLNRRLYGETLYSMYVYSGFGTYWFADNMKEYAKQPEKLPFEQHELIALAAPRAVCIHSATEDQWADPKSEYLSAYYAGPVYKLFGKQSLDSETPPEADLPVGTDVSYFMRTGAHNILLSDWEHYLNIADRVFRKTTV